MTRPGSAMAREEIMELAEYIIFFRARGDHRSGDPGPG
jgi:hypothetical protein